MTGKDERRVSGGDRTGGVAGSVNVAAIVGAVVVLGLIAYGVYRMREAPSPPPAPIDAAGEDAPLEGTPITAVAPVALSPEARVAVERYRCVCGCNDPLSECTCSQSPGSIEMKNHLQDLVDRGLSMSAVDEGMVAAYGDQVLLTNSPAGDDTGKAAP